MSEEKAKNEVKGKGFNFKIAKTFLENQILTLMSLVLLLALGIGTTLMMKTTGFPNPEIRMVVISTFYQGASSEIVEDEVTTPIERAISDVEGISGFSSTSQNSVSSIVIQVESDVDVNDLKNKLDSSLDSVDFPEDSSDPAILSPEVSSASFVLSLISNNPEKLYNSYIETKDSLESINGSEEVELFFPVEKRIVVDLNEDKAGEYGVTASDVKDKINSIGESLPISSDAVINNQSVSVSVSVAGEGLDQLKNLIFVKESSSSQSQGRPGFSTQAQAENENTKVKLQDIADIKVDYVFQNESENYFAYNVDGKNEVTRSLDISVKTVDNTDLSAFYEEMVENLNDLESIEYVPYGESISLDENSEKVILAEVYSIKEQNDEQVDGVISGLIGGPLDVGDSVLAQVGWLLGGIQLVFIVMLVFVSWRAAIIAAASIPLSLIFTNIYLFFIGESLNTLVLFSLVLVIGLVVDPALVVLESVQRKIDAGFRGKEAALEAVKDVGNGIFLAALTNIIVFAPFAILSGFLGEIFSYIPLTIIPAVIGSYIVPLIFLVWFGGMFLRPTPNSRGSEEDNLWDISKKLIKFNEKILNGSALVRLGIIVGGIVIPFLVAGFVFGTGGIRVVQFSSSEDAELISLQANFVPSLTEEQKGQTVEETLDLISKNSEVREAFRFAGGGAEGNIFYYINLKEDRESTASEIAKEFDKEIVEKFEGRYFDVNVSVAGTGPGGSFYQTELSVKSEDPKIIENFSKDAGEKFSNLCMNENGGLEINKDCSEEDKVVEKVDDGFTGKEVSAVEIVLDREKAIENSVTSSQIPFFGGLVNSQVRDTFGVEPFGEEKSTLLIDEKELNVIFEEEVNAPQTLEEIKNLEITNLKGESVKISEVAEVQITNPRDTINKVDGDRIGTVRAQFKPEYRDNQAMAGMATSAVQEYYTENDGERLEEFGLESENIGQFNEGVFAEFAKTFTELIVSLILAIFVSYMVLALFFKSFTQPLSIIYTVPLTFVGIFPALAYLGLGQFGFLEIIGVIILIGIVENVAIFLIDLANQKIEEEGWDPKRAISYASGVRLRPVILTSLTAVASLAPLALFSEFYRSISLVIIFGILTSGVISLITTPILFSFFKSMEKYLAGWLGKNN